MLFHAHDQVVVLKKEVKRLTVEVAAMAADAQAATQERDDMLAAHTVGGVTERVLHGSSMTL